MRARSQLSFPIEQYQHLPNPYPHDAIRDSFIRTNIVNLDLASPPPQLYKPPLTPPETPLARKTIAENSTQSEVQVTQLAFLEVFLAVGLVVDVKARPTRYLAVGGVPPDVHTSLLSRIFCRMGDLKGIFVRYQHKGVVVLSWHDVRHANKARMIIQSSLLFGLAEPLCAAFITPQSLIKATGKSPFVNGSEGNLSITANLSNPPSGHQPVSLHAALALFGDLSSFSTKYNADHTTFDVSYYDARDAINAKKYLNGRSILGMELKIADEFEPDGNREWQVAPKPATVSSEVEDKPSTHPITPLSPASAASTGHRLPQKAHAPGEETGPVLYRTPISLGPLPPTPTSPVKRTKKALAPSASVANLRTLTSNTPSTHQQPKSNVHIRTVPPRLSLPWLNASMPGGPLHQKAPHMNLQPSMFNHTAPGQGGPPTNQSSPRSFVTGPTTPYHSQNNSTSTADSMTDSGPATPNHVFPHGNSPALSKAGSFEQLPQESPTAGLIRNAHLHSGGAPGIPEKNSVSVSRIEAGLDTRTTVMLKNIPNKMSDSDLRKYISEVVPNSFDFMYLRFDFNSSANVGYAFVNFTEVSALLAFAKARLGVKWNMFCSEKVLQMSYANFQGKEALVEKFKNSCVMEMQDNWVPKIFYSSGPKKGQREPFPPPTNPSRARRSQDQRERGLLRTGNAFTLAPGRSNFKPQ